MTHVAVQQLEEHLALADALRAGRDTMLEPQDLPGRYGHVVKGVDRVLAAIHCEAVVGGGWAVWRHGFVGRVTQDLDIVLPADRIDEFLQVAAVSGFQVLPQPPGRWPKVHHKESDVQVDILPEGERPGVPPKLAPTLIPHPARLGGGGDRLRYIDLPNLIELKLAAGRVKDEADVIELIRANLDRIEELRKHLAAHADYAAKFETLVLRAQQDEER
jgi:hypothetical protein